MASRGRPSKLDQTLIVDTALELGLKNLSLKKIAQHLGVSMGAIYHHLSGIDHLYQLVADRLVENIEITLETDQDMPMDTLLIKIAHQLRAKFLAMPGHADIAQHRAFLKGNILAVHEQALRHLVTRGLHASEAFLLVRTLAEFVESSVARQERWQADLDADLAATLDECLDRQFTLVATALSDLRPRFADQHFDAGLNTLIKGFMAQYPALASN